MASSQEKSMWERLREPFPAEQIEHKPQLTCRACGDAKQRVCDRHEKCRCSTCAAYMSNAHIDLDVIGHARTTDRLLAVDPEWNWEPLAFDNDGLPKRDPHGGMWIKLTVCGVTRYGYGDAQDKQGPNAVKETIGDALRNAAMRFGVALDLWIKDETTSPNGDGSGGTKPADGKQEGGGQRQSNGNGRRRQRKDPEPEPEPESSGGVEVDKIAQAIADTAVRVDTVNQLQTHHKNAVRRDKLDATVCDPNTNEVVTLGQVFDAHRRQLEGAAQADQQTERDAALANLNATAERHSITRDVLERWAQTSCGAPLAELSAAGLTQIAREVEDDTAKKPADG